MGQERVSVWPRGASAETRYTSERKVQMEGANFDEDLYELNDIGLALRLVALRGVLTD